MLTEAPRSTTMHRERLDAVVAARGLRAAVASSYQAVTYFSGAHIMTQIVVPDRLEFFLAFEGGESMMLVCNLEASMVRSQSDATNLAEYVEFADVPADRLVEVLRERGVDSGRIGLETRR